MHLLSSNVLIIMGLTLTTFIACQSEPPLTNIQQLEQKLQAAFDAERLDTERILSLSDSLATALVTRASQTKDADSAAKYLFRAGSLLEQDPTKVRGALRAYDQIISRYPDHEHAADALFKKGWIYNNSLQDLEKAERAYSTFLSKYPTHNLAASAEAELKFLGISPEEWMRRMQDSTNILDSISPD